MKQMKKWDFYKISHNKLYINERYFIKCYRKIEIMHTTNKKNIFQLKIIEKSDGYIRKKILVLILNLTCKLVRFPNLIHWFFYFILKVAILLKRAIKEYC